MTAVSAFDPDTPDPELRPVRFWAAGLLIGDRDRGVPVVSCSACCALIVDDTEGSNRRQHVRVVHGGER